MDELAVALQMDPLEFRLRNYAEIEPHESKPFASKALRACYQQGAEAFGWARRTHEPRSMRDGNMLIGWGMATSTYPTHRMPASTRVRLGANGTALVQAGTQDLGTGTYTVMSQIAADTLGMNVHRVQFELGDSTFPHAPVSGGSMTVASVGPAVLAACEAMRERTVGSGAERPAAGLARHSTATRCVCRTRWSPGHKAAYRWPNCWHGTSRTSSRPPAA